MQELQVALDRALVDVAQAASEAAYTFEVRRRETWVDAAAARELVDALQEWRRASEALIRAAREGRS